MDRRQLLIAFLSLAAAGSTAAAQAQSRPNGRPKAARGDFPNITYADWSDEEPPYRLYPGDELEITVPSAPELNKSGIIQPDGRIALPLIGAVMVADRTLPEIEQVLTAAYASQLLRPRVLVAIKATQPLRVFVGGEVDKPGVYDMPGDINSLQAVIQAGGFRVTAKRDRVVILRRIADGRFMMRTVDLKKGSSQPGVDLVPLRRFDVVFVPRSSIAEANLFVQQYVRDLLPISFSLDVPLNK